MRSKQGFRWYSAGQNLFFSAWAGAHRKLIMALEKKSGLIIFTFSGRPGNKLKKKVKTQLFHFFGVSFRGFSRNKLLIIRSKKIIFLDL